MTDEDSPRFFCGACGSIFGMGEIEDFDDVKCPECGVQDTAPLEDA